MRARLSLALLLALLAVSCMPAEEIPPPRPGEAGDFDRLFTEWKKLLSRLEELRKEYPTAKDDKKPALEKEFNELIKKGDALAPRLQAAAEAAYLAEPSKNEPAANFLVSTAFEEMKQGDYEEAARITKLLIDNEFPDKSIFELAGIAAFESSDIQTAQKYLKQAEENQGLSDFGKKYVAEVNIRAAEAKADDLPRVRLKTSTGDIVVELFENEAPQAVANFISLVESKFYDGLTFHRVLDNFMAQGGCPEGTGSGGPGYHIPCECYEQDHRLHFRGSLSMAHAGRDTGGSQFFLTFRATDHLDGKHTAFGRVIEGLDVLSKIQKRDPEDPNAPAPDKIVEATVIRKRPHKYKPTKLPERG